MSAIFQNIHRLLGQGKKSVLARIVRHTGSAPRTTGTKCIIVEDGSIIGTIGGGLLEYQVSQKAEDVFRSGKSTILHFRLTGKELENSEMLCGGTADVYLEPIFPENRLTKELFLKVNEMILAGGKGTLLTVIAEGIDFNDTDCHVLIDGDGKRTGSTAGYKELESLESKTDPGTGIPALLEPEKGNLPVFSEAIRPDDVLYLFGAGHISVFVASLASMMGFKVFVIDDRKDFASRERFEQVEEIIVRPFEEVFDHISVTAASYMVIVTRGHIHDRDVLRRALNTKPAYIGMIGSRRKRRVIYDSLMEEGITKETLEGVHSPIGLDIGAETPEEIAVSIVAELIHVRAAVKENKRNK